MNQETKAVLDWVLETLEQYLAIERASLSTAKQKAGLPNIAVSKELQDLYAQVDGNCEDFAKLWILRCMEQELGFNGKQFDISSRPEVYMFDQFSFVAVMLRLGLKRIDWNLVGEGMKAKVGL